MLGWIAVLVGIVLIVMNAKSVFQRTQPLLEFVYNNFLGLFGYTAPAPESTNPTDVTKPNTPVAAPTTSTETAPAPTNPTDTTKPNPPDTTPVGATSSIWPVEFFITTDVIAVVAGIALIYFGIKSEFPPAPPALMGGKRRRRV